jgi:hypothetical protein
MVGMWALTRLAAAVVVLVAIGVGPESHAPARPAPPVLCTKTLVAKSARAVWVVPCGPGSSADHA